MGNHKKDTDATKPTHHEGARKGEEILKEEGKEAGRKDAGETGASRPAGESTARDSTRVNPKSVEAQDPKSPKMPPA
jgi:hypothetical protein